MFDEEKAKRTVDFINCLKHTKGKWRGQPFELLPWQEAIIRDVFGTVKENGYRQYNTAYVEIPKKNGKSELAAGVALYMTCGDNEWGAEVYGCASDRQQASIVFDVAVDMVEQCPALKKRIKPVMSVKRLVYKPTNSFYQVLSAEAYTKHGLNVHAVIFDELHSQPNRELFGKGIKGNLGKLTGPMKELAGALIPATDSMTAGAQAAGGSGGSSSLAARLDAMYEVVTKYLPRLANSQVVLDSGVLVGELSDGLNRELGKAYS